MLGTHPPFVHETRIGSLSVCPVPALGSCIWQSHHTGESSQIPSMAPTKPQEGMNKNRTTKEIRSKGEKRKRGTKKFEVEQENRENGENGKMEE